MNKNISQKRLEIRILFMHIIPSVVIAKKTKLAENSSLEASFSFLTVFYKPSLSDIVISCRSRALVLVAVLVYGREPKRG